MKKLKENKSIILIFIIGALSLINILLSFKRGNYIVDIISIIGIFAVGLFFLKKEVCRYFIWIWIIAQAITINHVSFDPLTNTLVKKTILDLSQAIRFKIGFYISEDQSAYIINFNLLITQI